MIPLYQPGPVAAARRARGRSPAVGIFVEMAHHAFQW